MGAHEEQTRITKANLQEAFWQMYEEAPIESITVGKVAQRAGYNRGTFYLHFADIYSLLQTIEDEVLEQIGTAVAQCMAQLDEGLDPEIAMQGVLSMYEDNRRYLVVLMGTHGRPSFVDRLKQQLKPLWAKYVLGRRDESGEYHSAEANEETDLVLEYTLSGALFMVGRWLKSPHGVSPEKLLHLIYHSALNR